MVDKRRFKDVEVSLLGLGTMRLPCETEQKRESNPNIDYEKAQKLVDLAYKNGVNYYDTAYMYHCGKSEKFIGHALKNIREIHISLPINFLFGCAIQKRICSVYLQINLKERVWNILISIFFIHLIKKILKNVKN